MNEEIKKIFLNKRIVKIDTICTNIWYFVFDDDSVLELEADTYHIGNGIELPALHIKIGSIEDLKEK